MSKSIIFYRHLAIFYGHTVWLWKVNQSAFFLKFVEHIVSRDLIDSNTDKGFYPLPKVILFDIEWEGWEQITFSLAKLMTIMRKGSFYFVSGSMHELNSMDLIVLNACRVEVPAS